MIDHIFFTTLISTPLTTLVTVIGSIICGYLYVILMTTRQYGSSIRLTARVLLFTLWSFLLLRLSSIHFILGLVTLLSTVVALLIPLFIQYTAEHQPELKHP